MKIFVTLSGIFFLGAILFLFWWLRWQEESQVHVDALTENITVLQSFWNKQSSIRNGKFEIGYQEALPRGFPFQMKVRLIKPFFRDTNGSKRFFITMPYVDFVPIDNASRSFSVEYPEYADAIFYYGSARTDYYLHLSSQPNLMLRKHSSRSAAVNEFGVTYPESLVFLVDSNGKQFKLPMKFDNNDKVTWRPLFSDMRLQMRHFSNFLRQSLMGL